MKKYYLLILFVLTIMSCRKSFKKPADEALVPVKFDAVAADTTANLTVQIFDTNTKNVYYNSTVKSNIYSGQLDVSPGASITFNVTSNNTTNINSQISSNNLVVASGAYNPLQSPGSMPAITLYYKIP